MGEKQIVKIPSAAASDLRGLGRYLSALEIQVFRMQTRNASAASTPGLHDREPNRFTRASAGRNGPENANIRSIIKYTSIE